MPVDVQEVSSDTVRELVQEMNGTGYACIPRYVRERDLSRMRSFVASAVDRSSNEYVLFTGAEDVGGSGLDELGRTPAFIELIHDLFQEGTGRSLLKQDFYQVLRCLTGRTGERHSMVFHYDSYVVTALVPIQIPVEGQSGDLLVFPNTRKIRRTYSQNVLDKLILGNRVAQKVLRSVVNAKKLGPLRIKMVPGNLYLFWGYRSVHTNEPCDPDKVRATALFHYGNPHKAG